MAPNPRKSRRLEHGGLLKEKRCLVEQFDGLVKSHILVGYWTRPRGITKKASMVMAELIGLNTTAIEALLQGAAST